MPVGKGGQCKKRWTGPCRALKQGRSALLHCRAVEPRSIYDMPEVYQEVFARDLPAEVAFLTELYKQRGKGQLQSFLDLGCGPALHAVALAQLGVQAMALDNSPVMLQYAERNAKKAGVSLQLLQANMQNFELPAGAHVDLAAMLLGTAAHLLHSRDLLACFQSVRKALRPGGLFVMELMHPMALFDGTGIIGDSWTAGAPGGPCYLVEYGLPEDEFDAAAQVLYRTVSVTRDHTGHVAAEMDKLTAAQHSARRGEVDFDAVNDELSSLPDDNLELLVESVHPQRLYTYQEVRIIAWLWLLWVSLFGAGSLAALT
ncbi:hypothetical protein WJX72_005033 [[Myrmecia] bisecta]|uniref:Methyltransferase domain-containing protein n=1 Tax=[Myrmecia] bisecta TaxID=41462 RepID=A0AAW1PTC7_9CHLO